MTITDFRLDYSSQLHGHYLTLGDFETAEDYIADCCNIPIGTILDFAAQYGAKAAKDLIKYYEKGYHKTVQVEPILVAVDDENTKEEILVTFEEPVFMAMQLTYDTLNVLAFSLKKSSSKLNRYETALLSSKMFEYLLLGETGIDEYRRAVDELNPKCEFGNAITRNLKTGTVELNLNSNDNRFEQLIGNDPDSYWHHLSFTDFQDDSDTDPSEDERRLIELQIVEIEDRIQELFPEKIN